MTEHVENTPSSDPHTDRESKDRRKTKIGFESELGREEIVQYFSAILDGLRQGTLTFKQGDKSLTVELADRMNLEVKAARKGREAKVSFEFSWKDHEPVGLEISSE